MCYYMIKTEKKITILIYFYILTEVLKKALKQEKVVRD